MNRREFLAAAARSTALIAAAPALAQAPRSRPLLTHGTASGDVTRGRGIVWSRTDRPARLIVEWDTSDAFARPRRVRGPMAQAATGFTARADLAGLPAGQRIVYRARFEDVDGGGVSEPAAGTFLSAPADRRDVTFTWSADTAGQGWGIDLARGGMRMFDTIRRTAPDFFIHCGDTIYADAPLPAALPLPDGSIWHNVVTPAKAKVAESLDEFRGNYLYNLMDEHVRRFNAEVPQVVLWDDHEVRNNWNPAARLDADPRYTTRQISVLAARARQAFLEHQPVRIAGSVSPRIFRSIEYGPLLDVFSLDLRTYRGANPAPGGQTAADTAAADAVLAGRQQIDWLKESLASSRALWKVIASDLPLGLVVGDPDAFDGYANGNGPARGRELELAGLLRFIANRRLRNIVWLTADVHYAAAHHYDPERARFKDFLPFWEFVAGPLHAGVGAPAELDDTFGPDVRFISVPPGAPPEGPASGRQFFGTVHIAGTSGVMTVSLHNLNGDSLYHVELEPSRG
jgi:alkaline phosphatase D